LGPHIKQAGSVVEATRLRFDFSHHKGVTSEELREIEDLVNGKIRSNAAVHTYELSFAEVQKRKEILQFFGDKYGDRVRVVDIDFSKELCGGTHTANVGTIGYFRIAKEGSIASGVRRIEAVTGSVAETLARSEAARLQEEIEQANLKTKELASQNTHLRRLLREIEIEGLLEKLNFTQKKIPFIFAELAMEGDELKECADLLMQKQKSLVLLLIGKQKEKCFLIARVSVNWVEKGIKASDLLKEVAPLVGGKGGGKAEAAQGGGTDVSQIPQALDRAKGWLEQISI